ncbi:PREDICTED: transmembrane protein 163-like isoform X1 [Priapulus caudatus]|uniref:Transmembrane protein 163-like isoform X1 n=1 Tax=Priapulus caudatus TaxID=37621 RepID=A0ABM1EXZ7_PRICU|nr:PREDICTED: transmembrane protein 163-like isoform X1 [Priapulus caudatus]
MLALRRRSRFASRKRSKRSNRAIKVADLVPDDRKLSPQKAVQYRKFTLVLTAISLLITLVLGITSLILSVADNSDAAFAFALDCLLDFLSSMVVLWRFFGKVGNLYSQHREKLACILLSLLFMISAVCVSVKAVYNLLEHKAPEKHLSIFPLFLGNTIACALLAVGKYYFGFQLESRALLTDAFNSLIGTLMGAVVMVSVKVYDVNPDIWFLDSSASVFFSGVLFLYGLWLLYHSVTEQ